MTENIEPPPPSFDGAGNLRHMRLNNETGLYEKTTEPAWRFVADKRDYAPRRIPVREPLTFGGAVGAVISGLLVLGLASYLISPTCRLSVGNTCIVQGPSPAQSFLGQLARAQAGQ